MAAEPRTEAGRRLLADWMPRVIIDGHGGDDLRDIILTIEREAAARRASDAQVAGRYVTLENARWLAMLLSPSNDPERQAEARQWADDWFAELTPPPATLFDAKRLDGEAHEWRHAPFCAFERGSCDCGLRAFCEWVAVLAAKSAEYARLAEPRS